MSVDESSLLFLLGAKRIQAMMFEPRYKSDGSFGYILILSDCFSVLDPILQSLGVEIALSDVEDVAAKGSTPPGAK